MPAHARSPRPESSARRRYARRHPGRAAAVLGALLVAGGAAAAGVAAAAPATYTVQLLGDYSAFDLNTGASCDYHLNESYDDYVPGAEFGWGYQTDATTPSRACGSITGMGVSINARSSEDIVMLVTASGRHDGISVLHAAPAEFGPNGGTQHIPDVELQENGMHLKFSGLTVSVQRN